MRKLWRKWATKTARRNRPDTRLGVENLEDRNLLSGGLDPSFGTNGKAVTDFLGNNTANQPQTIVMQSNGEFVGVGTDSGGTTNILAHFQANGQLDTTNAFGGANNGYITIPGIPNATNAGVGGITLDSNGNILIVGRANVTGTGFDMVVERFTSAGILDATFNGGKGYVTTDIGSILTGNAAKFSSDIGWGIAVQNDGKIVVGGSTTPNGTTTAHWGAVRYNSDGSLDTNFGTGGVVDASFAGQNGSAAAFSVGLQSNGGIILVGSSTSTVAGSNSDMAAIRLTSTGAVDGTFGNAGLATIDFAGGADLGMSVGIASDNSIYVGGTGSNTNGTALNVRDLALAKLTPTGQLDATFAMTSSFGPGKLLTDVSANQDATYNLKVDAKGRIILGGYGKFVGTTNLDFVVARYTPTGSLDTSFNGTGLATVDFQGGDDGSNGSLALDANGNIIVGGYATIANVAAAGTHRAWGFAKLMGVDSATISGAATSPEGLYALTLNSGGSPTVTSWTINWGDGSALQTLTGNPAGVGHYYADGPNTWTISAAMTDALGTHTTNTLAVTITNVAPQPYLSQDPTFSASADFFGLSDSIQQVIPLAGGKILAVGAANAASGPLSYNPFGAGTPLALALARFNADGSLDSSFGTGGKFTFSVPSATAQGLAGPTTAVVLADGSIIVGGATTVGGVSEVFLVKLTANGSIATTFGSNGFALFAVPMNLAQTIKVAQDSNGNFVFCGQSSTSPNTLVVARLLANGQADTSFGSGGIAQANLPAGTSYGFYSNIAFQSDGKILVNGAAAGLSMLVRFNTNGSLDTSFGSVGSTGFGGGGFAFVGNPGGSILGSYGIVVNADDTIVIGEQFFSGAAAFTGTRHAGLAKFLANGAPDTSFGVNGIVDLPLTGNQAQYNIYAGPNGTIIGSARTVVGSTNLQTLIRYNPNGSLDTTFGSNGVMMGTYVGLNAVVQADGTILAFGSQAGDFKITRFLAPGGSLTATEGSTFTDAGVFSDPGSADGWTATVDYGDGTGTQALALGTYQFNLSHVYADNGTYTITVTVTDKDGGSGTTTQQVIVTNVAPTATFTGSSTVQGTSGTVTFSGQTDPSSVDTSAGFTYRYATTQAGLATATSTTSSTASFTYNETGTYTLWGRIYDKDGDYTDYSTTIVVGNSPPTATFNNSGPVSEGSVVVVSFANASDPSPNDTAAGFHYSISTTLAGLANSYAAAGMMPSGNFTFDDNGSYVVYGRIFDSEGGSRDYQTTVTVTNVSPLGTLTSTPGTENTTAATVSYASVTDPSTTDASAGFHYSFALTPAGMANSYASASSTNLGSFSFANSGTYTVYGRVFDKDGGFSDTSILVTVTNIAPTATFGSNTTSVNEGDSVTVSLTGPSDPSPADTAAGFRYSFATNPAALAPSYAAAGTATSASLVINDSGIRTVYGRIFDKDGGFTDYSINVTSANVAPTATLTASPTPVAEGSGVAVSFTGGADPSSADLAAGLHYSFALSSAGLAGSYAAASASPSGSVVLPDNGNYTIYGRVFDKDGGYTDYTTTASAYNVAPVGTMTNSSPANAGTPVTVSFNSVTEPSPADGSSLHYSFALSPSGLAGNYALAPANASATFTLPASGTYTVYGRVFDKDGGFSDTSTDVTVENLPASPGGGTGAGVAGALVATGSDAGSVAEVKVYDGATGAMKFDLTPFGTSFRGGARVAVGDVNGDGTADVIVGAGPGGGPQVEVFDGKTGQLILSTFGIRPTTFTGGVNVAAGDINGDGYADIIVSADAGGGPQVVVWSGKDGTMLRAFNAFDSKFTGGVRVAAGDVNDDGKADVITAAGKGGSPQVTIFDGATGSLLSSFYAFNASFRGGVNIAAGDVNGDGIADIFAGAGAGGGPQVSVFDGRSRQLMSSFFAFDPKFTGGVRVGAVDSNGDGKADIRVAAGPGGGPQVETFDGSTLSLLGSFFAYDPSLRSGVNIAAGKS